MNTLQSATETSNGLGVKLSRIKEGRLHVLSMIFGRSEAQKLLAILPDRGKNRYDAILITINIVNNSSGEDRRYFQALTDAFRPFLGTRIEDSQILDIVCNCRSKLKLPPFTGNVHKQCINEFKKTFLVFEHIEPSKEPGKKGHRVYQPRYALLRS